MHQDCHDWEMIWDDGVGVRCCVCTICDTEKIFEYDAEEEILTEHFLSEMEKEFDKWELRGYWNV